jgi:hypothetical protein
VLTAGSGQAGITQFRLNLLACHLLGSIEGKAVSCWTGRLLPRLLCLLRPLFHSFPPICFSVVIMCSYFAVTPGDIHRVLRLYDGLVYSVCAALPATCLNTHLPVHLSL